jgi:TolA-binding protein
MRNKAGSVHPGRARRWLLVLTALACLLPGIARAVKPGKDADSAETNALTVAQALFDDQQYSQAEARLATFLATYTNSTHRAYARLFEARARYGQSNYDGAIQLLTNGLPQAGPLAGEYVFWTASAHLGKGEAAQAAAGFAAFIQSYPDSPRLLEAAYDQAESCAKMENWPRVAELLQQPGHPFVALAAADPKNTFVRHGRLLLAEALLVQGKYDEGEAVARGIAASSLEPEWQWQRLYLLCRLQLARGQYARAWDSSSNLLDTVTGARHQAAGRYLRGQILEALGRPREALTFYTNNLAPGLPSEYVQQALVRTIALVLSQRQIEDGVQLLENYVAQSTNVVALDLARLSLGELYLKLHFSPALVDKHSDLPLVVTNYLAQAQTNFDSVIQDYPASPLVPKAHLDRGWCDWAQTNMPAAQKDFQAAADGLRHSPEEAIARFKLADAEFYQHDYASALANYKLLLRDYAQDEAVTNGLFDQALYQIVEVSLANNDTAGATAAVQKILEWYPNSLFGDRGQLLIGETTRYNYAVARKEFEDLLQRSPQTPLRAEVQYAIARTFEQEGNWPEALRQYQIWLSHHGGNAAPLLRARVEYSRALVYGKAGMETNALNLFTNFVARYPSNVMAAWAQNWVADYYFNLGDYPSAEANYEVIYQSPTFPSSGDLPYQARLMAGRAALEGQRADEASQHFADLVALTNAPDALRAQGWFALGDAIMQQFRGSPTNTTLLGQAIAAFSKVTNGAPTNALAVQAIGKLGDCYKFWADIQWDFRHDPLDYTNATQMYKTVLSYSPADVDVPTRSQADVALGMIAERQGQTEQALAHYCNVLYALDPDAFDPYWIEQAGVAAARLYQNHQQWEKAIRVYQRVARIVPSLRGTLEKFIIDAQRSEDKERN